VVWRQTFHVPAHRINKPLHKIETDAHPMGLRRVEWSEHETAVTASNADSRVNDLDYKSVVLIGAHVKLDHTRAIYPLVRHSVECIVYQIDQDGVQFTRIEVHSGHSVIRICLPA
jgi:hypothetical protein